MKLLKQAESGDLAGGTQVLDPAGESRTWLKRVRLVRKCRISSSGLTPLCGLLIDFKISRRSKTIEVVASALRDATGGGRLVHGRRRLGRQGVTREATGPPGSCRSERDGGEKLPPKLRST